MVDEIPERAQKTEDEKALAAKKRAIRLVRDEIKALRKQAQEIAAKRKELDGKYRLMAEDAGLSVREKKSKE